MHHSVIFVACCLLPVYVTSQQSPRIIIVGSGAAGIAAASRLLQNGFDNLTILEAEHRIGGRIHTTKFGEYWVDLGGQWIHGEEDNVAYELAWPLGLVEKSNESWSFNIFGSSGNTVPEEAGNDLMEFYFNLSREDAPDEYLNKSIGEYFKTKIDEYLKHDSDIRAEERKPLEEMLNLFEMSHDAGDDWLNVSAKGLREYHRCPGDEGINWKDKGYSMILDILMKKIPNPKDELPILNKTVLKFEASLINYNIPEGNVRVVGSNGEAYSAEHVIVTTSLGVLKSDHKTLFSPPLPESKVKAIQGLEFGNVAKIYLYYPEPWWNVNDSRVIIGFHWSNHDREEMKKDPEKAWMLGLFSLMRVAHKPKLLCCWLAGPHAREMENIPTERVLSQTKEMLRRFLGKSHNLTEPTDIMRTQWFTNKHFRGTYSYRSLATEASGVMAIHLQEPVPEKNVPLVLFAGEATSPHYYSTVHGAIESGWREADRLIKHYDNRKSEPV